MNWVKNPPVSPIEVVNWSLITSAQELLAWVPEDYRLRPDRAGYYRLTGFEETGRCWWCGGELTGKQRKWCTRFQVKAEHGHWIDYYNHFSWGYARAWCFERYDYQCANCGKKVIVPAGDHPSWYTGDLEAHHIIPLEGRERQWTPYNLPWNLICLCHQCHLEAHAAMRPSHDPWEIRISTGQMPLIPQLRGGLR